MITSNDRVAFEKWADEQGYELGRRAVPYTSSENRNGDYQSRTTQVSWLAWEACSEMRSVETSQSLALDLRSNLHGGPTPALHDGVTGKAKCVICGNFNRFWHVISGCNFCQSCVSEALSSPEEPSPRRCHCGQFLFAHGMALITDEHAHDHAFDGTHCDCEGAPECLPEKASATPTQEWIDRSQGLTGLQYDDSGERLPENGSDKP